MRLLVVLTKPKVNPLELAVAVLNKEGTYAKVEHIKNRNWSSKMATNKKKTSRPVAKLAAETLKDPNASATAKSLAASALSQSGNAKQTGAEMEDKASMVLSSSKFSAETKKLAGSVLSQSNKAR